MSAAKSLSLCLLVAGLAATGGTAPLAGEAAGDGLRLQVLGQGGTVDGVGHVIHREDRERDVVLYVMTDCRLLDPAVVGETDRSSLKFKLFVDESTILEARGHDIAPPRGAEPVDVAVIAFVAPKSARLPAAVNIVPYCDPIAIGDVSVPPAPASRSLGIDATASLTTPKALRLGDVTIAELADRVIKLRFTMPGAPPSLFAPPNRVCPQGQALVTVRVNVVVLSRP